MHFQLGITCLTSLKMRSQNSLSTLPLPRFFFSRAALAASCSEVYGVFVFICFMPYKAPNNTAAVITYKGPGNASGWAYLSLGRLERGVAQVHDDLGQ